ncbi:MAG TPA: sigma-E factor regulatory protein RseB domain-containing protein [Jatrophihabitans sp.]|nr:sigma-E factor regulatory protein RseB domain-containing protein [Jatrophihabitans sp.]
MPAPARSATRLARPLAVPVLTAAVVAAGAVALGGLHPTDAFASQHPTLPARTPLQLLTAAETSTTRALSGTVTEQAHWGLPSLPGADGAASLSWQGLLTGSHTVRVAIDGPNRQRLAVLGSLSEADVVHNGQDVWTYTSAGNSVSHSTLPARQAPSTKPAPDQPWATLTPQGAAQQLLDAIQPSTRITVDPTQRVAGRSAYTLVLTPKDGRSTVRKVAIALDSQHFVPLRVQLYGAGANPAFETAFSSISFTPPAASTFIFRAPAGARTATDPFGFTGSKPGRADTHATAQPTVLGTGWASVLKLPPMSGLASGGADPRHGSGSPASMLNSLTTPLGTSGARVLHTAVINALITKDGRIYLGAVSVDLLQAAAAGTYK